MGACTSKPVVADGERRPSRGGSSRQRGGGRTGPANAAAAPIVTGAPKGKSMLLSSSAAAAAATVSTTANATTTTTTTTTTLMAAETTASANASPSVFASVAAAGTQKQQFPLPPPSPSPSRGAAQRLLPKPPGVAGRGTALAGAGLAAMPSSQEAAEAAASKGGGVTAMISNMKRSGSGVFQNGALNLSRHKQQQQQQQQHTVFVDDGVAGSPAALALQGLGGGTGHLDGPLWRGVDHHRRSQATDDPRWVALYRAAVPHILDPNDVHSAIDERLNKAVDSLSPTEVTMLLRRVRDVMRTVAAAGGSERSSIASSTGGTVSGMVKSLVGAATSAATSASSSGGGSSGGGGGGGGGSASGGGGHHHHQHHSHHHHHHSHQHHYGLDGTAEFDGAKSKAVYKNEGTLDEGVVRRVFSGGEAVLRRGYESDVPGTSRRVFVKREEMKVASGPSSAADAPVLGGEYMSPSAAVVASAYDPVVATATTMAMGGASAAAPNVLSPDTPTRRSRILWSKTPADASDDAASAGDGGGGGGGGRRGSHGTKRSRHNGHRRQRSGGGGGGANSAGAGPSIASSSASAGYGNAVPGAGSASSDAASLAYRVDPIGSAFVLGAHLAESRWDAVAAVAKLSAKLAGLEMDVNKSKVEREGEDKNDASAGGPSAAAAAELPGGRGAVAPPPPEVPTADVYREAVAEDKDMAKLLSDLWGENGAKPLSSPVPGGVSLAAICFLVASALRGTRSQRLALLFYLLLPADELRAMLAHHPSGGVPTWLLEAGGDAVLSYASLGHYWYLGGELPEGILPPADDAGGTETGASRSAGRGRAILLAPRAIGAIAVLLMDALEAGICPPDGLGACGGGGGGGGGGSSDRSAAAPSSAKPDKDGSGKGNGGNKRSSAVGGPKRIRRGKGHAALNARLHDARSPPPALGGAPGFVRRSHPWHDGIGMAARETIMDRFWRVSHEAYAPAALAPGEVAPHGALALFWSFDDFMAWSDAAGLDDHVLDMVTHRLFGTGVFPTPSMEAELVSEGWMEWQRGVGKRWRADWDRANSAEKLRGPNWSDSGSYSDGSDASPTSTLAPPFAWGGVGGIDGRGGLGYGVLYCVDKKWWDEWMLYSGFRFENENGASTTTPLSMVPQPTLDNGDKLSLPLLRQRPHELSTERLLDRSSDGVVAGIMGSYEEMRTNVYLGKDYVLIPPGVWDILYELYGGGPPLPRMVLPPTDGTNGDHEETMYRHRVEDGSDRGDMPSVEVVASYGDGTGFGGRAAKNAGALPAPPLSGLNTVSSPVAAPARLPPDLSIYSHPWVLHCHACDPRQPYRRGDAGPFSIRIMVSPDQPLWRLFGEIVCRLPLLHPKARDGNGRGRARLWRRIDPPGPGKENAFGSAAPAPAITRYGPWVLLCKSRWASFPFHEDSPLSTTDKGGPNGEYNFDKEMREEWLQYTDHSSCESAGLADGMRIMFEYALVGKDGSFAWPREAAAKAGRMRRLADEDTSFRRMLRGLDSSGKLVQGSSPLIGKVVDAMDSSGRWYQAEIVKVHKGNFEGGDDAEEEPPEEGAEDGMTSSPSNASVANGENRAVRVDFSDVGGHEEWIEVKSDRLAVAGRYTLDSIKNLDSDPTDSDDKAARASGAVAATRGKPGVGAVGTAQSSGPDLGGNGAYCPFPGYGACGLSNLGNTCYANSALQCVAYMPLLRSYLLSGQYKLSGDLNRDNPLGTGGKLLEEFVELLRVMWNGKYGVRAPSRFRAQLGRARSQYSGGDQQDAQELLNDMLDTLHEDSNKVKKKPYVEALEDDWVKNTGLPRVGVEAWRRFLRRNRSVIADVAMGQTLNRVTCPVCHHESRNFDPFNMLSIPFPTVAEVIFRCRIVRRGTARNCPDSLGLGMPGLERVRSLSKESEEDTNGRESGLPSPPSDQLVFEEYIVPMSRLADVGDLKLRLQNICGISMTRLKLCKAEDVVVSADAPEGNPTRTYVKVTPLLDKEGPCLNLANKQTASNGGTADDVSTAPVAPTQIVAFESTLSPRTSASSEKRDDSNGSEESGMDDDEDLDTDKQPAGGSPRLLTNRQRRIVQEHLEIYGDKEECRIYDTDPTPLSKAMSRSLWPMSADDFKLGLRVDAIDHRNHWFPGSVVEIIEGIDDSEDQDEPVQINGKGTSPAGDQPDNSPPTKTKVRIHFDNFSSKWDETYTIDHFKRGRVRPLYSHAPPRGKPTEFLVHHRHRVEKGNALFGQPFYLQCHNEWSTARAGAQILAQASRFLQPAHLGTSAVSGINGFEKENGVADNSSPSKEVVKSLEHARAVLSQIIDMLLESDRSYVDAALRAGDVGILSATNGEPSRDDLSASAGSGSASRPFNATIMSSKLSKKLGALLPQLPFDVRVCTADAPLGRHQGGASDEVTFPFSLVRTIGNYMDARHAVVLHWKDRSGDSQLSRQSSTSVAKHWILRHPLLYVQPSVGVHKRSRALLSGETGAENEGDGERGPPLRKIAPGHGGMRLGVCLNEFCKEQHLPETDNWRCPKCREVREGRQHMILWKLPDILVFHLKRFNCSARWREKITTKVNFPLTGLNMSEWCDRESPSLEGPEESCVYDLIGVVNHYGGMTGGHYVATCKATACSADGSEEVAYNFNGAGISAFDAEEETVQTGWRLGRSKDKDSTTAQTKAATAAARSVAESAEPLWLQFDDDLVEPIPPRNVVSEMAYVLFYRKRRFSPSNIAKYSTLE